MFIHAAVLSGSGCRPSRSRPRCGVRSWNRPARQPTRILSSISIEKREYAMTTPMTDPQLLASHAPSGTARIAAPAAPAASRRWSGRSSALLLAALGIAGFLAAWYLAVDVLALPRFAILPGPTEVLAEWTSRDPDYGVSLFTASYYQDIWISLRRVLLAFTGALALGVPLGLWLGWSRRARDYAFPVLELLRPIPILAWVPLAILMFAGTELPVLFLTFLAAFFATTLNSLLGVQSIDRDLIRAARGLGARPRDVFRT